MASVEEIGSFSIDLTLHHPSCAPDYITQELGVQPWYVANVGQAVGKTIRKSAVWMAHYQKGRCNSDFSLALAQVSSLLDAHRSFLQCFVKGGGEILLTLNHCVAVDDGIVFSIVLEPQFLRSLGEHGAAVQVHAWSAETSMGL